MNDKESASSPNLAIAGPFRSCAAVAPSEERCSHRERLTLCPTRLRVWQKSRGRGGKSPALLVSSILNATRYKSLYLSVFRYGTAYAIIL
jgi:hypothetical protein